MDLNSYIWLLAPKCRKALVVLTKYAVYFLCLILLCDYVDKLSAFYNGDVYLGKDGNYYFAVLIQREYLDTIFTSNSAFLTICYTNMAAILVILFLGIQQFFRNIKSGQQPNAVPQIIYTIALGGLYKTQL